MNREIGSEFWEVDIDNAVEFPIYMPHQYFLTGRTALDYLIKDIKINKNIKNVYMPFYCCHSMIQPFLDNGVEVEFYDVCFENGKYTYKIDLKTQCDVIFIMQYFGYCNNTVGQLINKFKELGKIIIEDATHSWLSDSPYNYQSDYVFASLRKWTGLPCGAFALKQEEEFSIKAPNKTNHKYIQIREQAATLKKQFIEKGIGQKETFLGCFNQAEKFLEYDYQNYNVPHDIEDIIKRLNLDKIKEKRKMNAEYLIKGISDHLDIETISQTNRDAPLFVPIIVHNGKRNELRQYLINNDIYCPIHWPISDQHRIKDKFLYDNSLSLVCDQRYTLLDMKRIIETINRFYGG